MPLKDEIHKIYEENFALMEQIHSKAFNKLYTSFIGDTKDKSGSMKRAKQFHKKITEELSKHPIYSILLEHEKKINYLSGIVNGVKPRKNWK